jgi:hypothetical protein
LSKDTGEDHVARSYLITPEKCKVVRKLVGTVKDCRLRFQCRCPWLGLNLRPTYDASYNQLALDPVYINSNITPKAMLSSPHKNHIFIIETPHPDKHSPLPFVPYLRQVVSISIMHLRNEKRYLPGDYDNVPRKRRQISTEQDLRRARLITTQNEQSPLFTRLPRELRDMIWEHAFGKF